MGKFVCSIMFSGRGSIYFLMLLSELSFKLLQVAFTKSTHVLGTPQLRLNWMT